MHCSVFARGKILEVAAEVVVSVKVDVVDFVAGRGIHNRDVETDSSGFAIAGFATADVFAAGGLDYSPFINRKTPVDVPVYQRRAIVPAEEEKRIIGRRFLFSF